MYFIYAAQNLDLHTETLLASHLSVFNKSFILTCCNKQHRRTREVRLSASVMEILFMWYIPACLHVIAISVNIPVWSPKKSSAGVEGVTVIHVFMYLPVICHPLMQTFTAELKSKFETVITIVIKYRKKSIVVFFTRTTSRNSKKTKPC